MYIVLHHYYMAYAIPCNKVEAFTVNLGNGREILRNQTII